MSKKLIYLASPYSHPDELVRELRFQQVTRMAAYIMQGGVANVFSPISHSHPVSEYVDMSQTGKSEHDFWLEQDLAILDMCDELWVYKMPGWLDSRGIRVEIDYALGHGIKVKYIGRNS